MPYVLDESSYRLAKNTFSCREEARISAESAAVRLGRPITVYELVAQELHFAFRVMPDGSVDQTDPLPNHIAVEPSAPAVLGSPVLDEVAEVLEQQGRFDLAAAIDEANEALAVDGPDVGIGKIAKLLKQDAELNR